MAALHVPRFAPGAVKNAWRCRHFTASARGFAPDQSSLALYRRMYGNRGGWVL